MPRVWERAGLGSLGVCRAWGEPTVWVVTPQPGGDGPGGGFVCVQGRAGGAGAGRVVRMRFQPLACVPTEFLAFGIVAVMVGGSPHGTDLPGCHRETDCRALSKSLVPTARSQPQE